MYDVTLGHALPREFYVRDTLAVARDLIGCTLCAGSADDVVAGVIVETEAYIAAVDPAAHGYNGMTPRNHTMFGPPGHAYVYRSYGIHACLCIVTEPAGAGAAVLVRALQPTLGLGLMRQRRGPAVSDRDLARGPGRLTQALGITLADDGADLLGDALWITPDPGLSAADHIVSTARIGLMRAVDVPWRFVLAGTPYVSRGVVRYNR